jgi:Kef-type K+ transport system membrane component KefB
MSFELLFLIVLAGLVGPLLSGSKRFAVPLVVGEIIAGIAIGDSGFRWINPADPAFKFLALVGFALLLFLVGIKLPLRNEGLRSALKVGAKASLLSFVLAVPMAFVLTYVTGIHNVGIFILLCACSSTSMVVPMFHERNLGGNVIVLTTAWIAMCDIVAMLALPLVTASGQMSTVALGVVVVSLAAIGCFVGMKMFRSTKIGEHLRALSRSNHWALDLRLSLAMLFGLAWLATVFGASVLVAGFAAGMVASSLGHPRRFYKQLIGIGEGFLVPVFFVHLGASINVGELFSSISNISLAVLICAASIGVHLLAARMSGLPKGAGLSASSQMGVPAALVSIGLSSGLLSPGQGAAIIAAALLSLIGSSYGVKLLSETPGVTFSKGGFGKKDDDEDPE